MTVVELLALDLDDAIDRVLAHPRVRAALTDGAGDATGNRFPVPLLMTPKAYGEHVGFCVRMLDDLLCPDCFVGTGRRRRVIVAVADERIVTSLAANNEPADNVIDLAMANARRTR